ASSRSGRSSASARGEQRPPTAVAPLACARAERGPGRRVMPSDEHSSEPSASVVVVTGLSGAGRSTALRALEDLGFYCVDNLPPTAFAPCLQACRRDRLQQVALGIDVRVK